MAEQNTETRSRDPRSVIGQQLNRTLALSRDEMKLDEEARTVEIAFASDTPVEHWFGYLILDHRPESIKLDRLLAGAPLLSEHDRDRQIGVHVSVSNDGHVSRAVVKFSRRPEAEYEWQDVKDGIRTNVSSGFIVHEMEPEGRDGDVAVYRATLWEPVESSIVSIPADISVGVGRSLEGRGPGEGADEAGPTAPPAGDEQRAAVHNTNHTEVRTVMEKDQEVIELGNLLGETEMARDYVASGKNDSAEFKRLVHEKRQAAQGQARVSADVDLSPKEARRYSIARAILGAAENTLDGLELEVHQALERQLPANYKRRGGVLIATRFGRQPLERAGLDSATSTKGTELKFTEAGEFIDLLRNRMTVAQLGARMLTGLQGPVSFPKQNGAASATWVGENPGSDVSDSNLTLTSVSLAPKTLQASTSFSRQLLAQSVIDVESLVREDLAQIHALAIDLAAVNGSGSSNQPRGILNTSGIGSVTGGTNGAAPTYANVVDLETAVAAANADIGVMAYLSTAVMRGKLKQTQKFSGTNGAPVWEGDEMNGYRAAVSNQVPSTLTKGTSSDCHAIIFGVWNQLLVGEWGAIELIVDPFRLKKQGMIETTSFQMVDVTLRYAEAFAAMKDARNV